MDAPSDCRLGADALRTAAAILAKRSLYLASRMSVYWVHSPLR